MTRPIDAIPLDASGRHVPSDRCMCAPIQATDLLEPARLVRIHHAAPREVTPDAHATRRVVPMLALPDVGRATRRTSRRVAPRRVDTSASQ